MDLSVEEIDSLIQTANDIFQIRLLLQLPAPSTSPVPASILPQKEEATPV